MEARKYYVVHTPSIGKTVPSNQYTGKGYLSTEEALALEQELATTQCSVKQFTSRPDFLMFLNQQDIWHYQNWEVAHVR